MTTDRPCRPAPPAPAPLVTPADPSSPRRHRRWRPVRVMTVVVVLALLVGACSSPADDAEGEAELLPPVSTPEMTRFPDGTSIRVMSHDSFAVSEDVLDAFSIAANVDVEIVLAGDAVAMVNQAILTAGRPQADLLFGIDDNLLARAAEAELFEPYEAKGLDAVPADLKANAGGLVTPIDYGDVCVNFDRPYFTERGLPIPTTWQQLVDPAYRDLLVVEDPTRSTPGLSFLLATIAELGGADATEDPAWLTFWQQLQANGVKVVDSWETAYYSEFSGGSGEGSRPLVVSYASSPPAEVTDESIPVDQAPTGVMVDTCYRQIEYAGVLRGASEPDAAKVFVDYMLSLPFQEDVPLQMYVFPVNPEATLPSIFAKFAEPVPDPLVLPGAGVDANRERWVQQWSTLFR